MNAHRPDQSWPYMEQFTPATGDGPHEVRLPNFPHMGLRLEERGKDYVKLSLAPPTGSGSREALWQRGLLTSLVDTTAGQALRTTLKHDHDAATVHLDTRYFRPMDEERVFVEGSVIRKGRTLARIHVAVVAQGGSLVARGSCVLKLSRREGSAAAGETILPPEPPAPPAPAPDCGNLEGGLGI